MEINLDGDVGVITFGAVSLCDAEQISMMVDEVCRFIEKNQPKGIVVNFSQVKFFSSQILGMLLNIRSKLKPYDGEVVISAIEPQLHRVFKITNLDKIFRFFPDKKSAVLSVSSSA